jgi:hypothetical protein
MNFVCVYKNQITKQVKGNPMNSPNKWPAKIFNRTDPGIENACFLEQQY